MRRRSLLGLGLSLLALAGCNTAGGGSSPTPPAGPQFYITDGLNLVAALPQTPSGNVNATFTISGSNTQLQTAAGIARDSSGNIYVANGTFTVSGVTVAPNNIIIFPAGQSGNVSPKSVVSGSNTGLGGPFGLAITPQNQLVVANATSNSVEVFAANPNGNVAPKTTIVGASTGLNQPQGVALDSSGNIYVANFVGNSITVYAAGASGNVAPVRTISGTATGLNGPIGVFIDKSQNLWVANGNGNSVTAYASGASGNVTPTVSLSGSSPGFDVPNGVAVDSGGNIYVTNFGSPGFAGFISYFAAGANGNVAPTVQIGPTNGAIGITF